MDDELSIEMQGAEELEAKLDAIGEKIKDSSVDSLIARAALAIERQAKINATGRPGPNVQTGRLRSSITTDIESYERARVGTDVFYAPFVEFGHKQHPGQYVPPLGLRLVNDFCPAYPFLYPAVDQCKDELEGVFVTFSNEIEGIFGK
jgi:HK97 gp10 family phage protein